MKRSFSDTEKSEHVRIFHQIVTSIHHSGEGLKDISFHSSTYNRNLSFLTQQERLHLEDVSIIVNAFYKASMICLIMTIIFFGILLYLQYALFSLKEILGAFSLLIVSLGLIIYIIDPLKLFYALHELFFQQNQWFFYYEESLMTTLMKAPDIFGVIAFLIFLQTIVFFISFVFISKYLKLKMSKINILKKV